MTKSYMIKVDDGCRMSACADGTKRCGKKVELFFIRIDGTATVRCKRHKPDLKTTLIEVSREEFICSQVIDQ